MYKIGDLITVIRKGSDFYKEGDNGIIVEALSRTEYRADFTANTHYLGEGKWYIGAHEFKRYEEQKPRISAYMFPR